MFGGMQIVLCEPGTIIRCDKTGQEAYVLDGSVVVNRGVIHMTAHDYEATKAHPNVKLHIWRSQTQPISRPPSNMVGPRGC